jgi:hypothetical protein
VATDTLSFTLVENALDFMLSAAEHAARDDARSLKYAVLHVAASAELLLKARLEREHWSLLFSDPGKADQRRFAAGDFRSADFDDAIDRLERIAGVVIDGDAKKHLRSLRDVRNRLQHFGASVGKEEAVSLLVATCGFCLDFLRTQIATGRNFPHDEIVARIAQHLGDFDRFVTERREAIQPLLSSALGVVDCPCCWHDTLVIGDGQPHCLFCGHTAAPEGLAETVGECRADEACLKCGAAAMAVLTTGTHFVVGWCMNCAAENAICLSCGHQYLGEWGNCPQCGSS